MTADSADLDLRVRLHIYERFAEEGRPPTVDQSAEALDASPSEVSGSFHRLAEGHVIVLEPGTPDVWMANPFSARPTAFRVESDGRAWWGNCVWDGPGILAALGLDGTVSSACPDCDEPMTLRVENGVMASIDGVAHFSVPARQWWEDIGFT